MTASRPARDHGSLALRVFSLDVVAKVALGAIGIVLIRFMPADEYARLTVALAAIAFGVQVLASAFNRIYIVGYEKLRLRSSAPSFLGFQLLMVLGVASVAFFWRGAAAGLFAVIVAVTLATCLSEFSKTVYQQELRFDRFAQVELARAALIVLGVGAVVAGALSRGLPVRAGPVLAVQAAALTVVFAVTVARRLQLREVLHPGDAVRFSLLVARSRYGWLFGYFALLGLLTQMDIFMLSALAPRDQVAAYGAAFRFYSLLSLALASVHAVLLPMVQQVATPEAQDRIMAKQWRLLAVFAPVVLLGAWAAGWIIPFLDQGRYPDAVLAFRLLAVSSIVSFTFSPHVHLVLRFEDFRFLCLLAVVAIAAHFGLLSFAVPRWGAAGAAGATLTTFAGVNGGTWLRARWRARRWAAAPHGSGAPPGLARA